MSSATETTDAEARARRLVAAADDAGTALAYDAAVTVVAQENLTFLDQAESWRQDQAARLRLLHAGRGLLAALEEVCGDAELWQRMRDSEGAAAAARDLPFRREMQLREILAHDVPAMLRLLGYRTPPPPPAEKWVTWMQRPLFLLLSSPSGADAVVAARALEAERELLFFLRRFRRLLDDAVELMELEVAHEEERADPLMRRLLVAGVTAARERAIPLAIAAGTAAFVVGGPLGGLTGATGAVGAVVVADVSKELVKTILEAVVATGLSSESRRAALPSTPEEDEHDAYALLRMSVAALPGEAQDVHWTEWVQWQFLVQRGVFDVLQSVQRDPWTQEEVWAVAQELLTALHHANVAEVRRRTDDLGQLVGPPDVRGFLRTEDARRREQRERDADEEGRRLEDERQAAEQREEERREAERYQRDRAEREKAERDKAERDKVAQQQRYRSS